MDTLGLVWALLVLPADTSEKDGGEWLLLALRRAVARLKVIWADGAYLGAVGYARRAFGWALVVVGRLAGQVGFEVLPKRWIVERTFGWLARYRRLNRDYERGCGSATAGVYVAMIHLMTRRLARMRTN